MNQRFQKIHLFKQVSLAMHTETKMTCKSRELWENEVVQKLNNKNKNTKRRLSHLEQRLNNRTKFQHKQQYDQSINQSITLNDQTTKLNPDDSSSKPSNANSALKVKQNATQDNLIRHIREHQQPGSYIQIQSTPDISTYAETRLITEVVMKTCYRYIYTSHSYFVYQQFFTTHQ